MKSPSGRQNPRFCSSVKGHQPNPMIKMSAASTRHSMEQVNPMTFRTERVNSFTYVRVRRSPTSNTTTIHRKCVLVMPIIE